MGQPPRFPHLNHAQRANTSTGGLREARYLRDGYCAGSSTLKSCLNATWYPCRWDKCSNTHLSMYDSGSDTLHVALRSRSQWDGGVTTRSCRWGSYGPPCTCCLHDADVHEGLMDTLDPNGDGSRTPLAVAILSLTTSSIMRAAWLRSTTGYDIEIVKTVRTSKNAPYSTVYESTYGCTRGRACRCTSASAVATTIDRRGDRDEPDR